MDFIQLFKISNIIGLVNKETFFTFAFGCRREHLLKLYKSRFNLNIGEFAHGGRSEQIYGSLSPQNVNELLLVSKRTYSNENS